jgi:pyruvate carboxylase
MKPLLLLPILALPLLLTGCETVVVDRTHHRSAHVERDVVVDRHDDHDRYDRRRSYDRDREVAVVEVDRTPRRHVDRNVVITTPQARRDVTVVDPRPYTPRTTVRYYNDTRGRYYLRDGRRVYSDAGVR